MVERVGENWKLSAQEIKPSTLHRLGRMTEQGKRIFWLQEYKSLVEEWTSCFEAGKSQRRQDLALTAHPEDSRPEHIPGVEDESELQKRYNRKIRGNSV